jgi:ribosomal-protein-alanine N-acetyltransferase
MTPSAPVPVEPAGPDDAPALVALHRRVAAETADASWDAAALTRLLDMPGTSAHLGRAPDGIDGFVVARTAADEAEILMIVVATDRRRRGLGRLLMAAAGATAARAGARRLFLEVAADNTPARVFYAALGLKPVGCRRGYYERGPERIDALILSGPVPLAAAGATPTGAPPPVTT